MTTTATASKDATLPSYTCSELDDVMPDLTLMSDLLSGTRTMQRKAKIGDGDRIYLPQWEDEKDSVYHIRRKGESVFGGLERTLSAGTGLLFSKPPAITWNASETLISPQWDNIDNSGTNGTVLLKRFTEYSLRDGLGAILVDHPSAPIDPETKTPIPITAANEAKFGLRPTWAIYARRQIINWQSIIVNGRKKFSLLVFAESADIPDGEYGKRTVQRYRVLRLVLTPDGYQAIWRLFERTSEAGATETYGKVGEGAYKNKNGVVADFLPVAIAYTGRTDTPMTASLPLLGVAEANLSHWQQSTDLRFYRRLCAFPQLVITGEVAPSGVGADGTSVPGKIRVGPMVVIHLANGGTAAWMELEGTSMEQLDKGIQEKLKQMSQLGLSFLMGDTRAAETAEAKRLDSTAETSTLATAAQGIDDAANYALEITAWYNGIEKAGAPVLAVNRDFESTVMDASTMGAYATLVAAGFPKREVLEAMQKGGRISPDANLDELEAKWQGAVDAEQEIKRMEAEERAKALANGGDPARAA